MISLLYYQETLTADAEGRARGGQNCYSGAILYLLHPTPTRVEDTDSSGTAP